ncbi:MAG: hypothetical protein VYB54_15455 [Pseudomonadota bacterium]|nr:hypothetical protein [Pseudomonadota bacterium]
MSSLRKLYRPSWAAWLSLALNVVVIMALAYVIYVGPRSSAEIPDWLPYCKPCEAASDSIENAAQLGRLDLVSLLLGILGVTLAILAMGGFFVVRAAAMDAARVEASERIRDELPKLITAEDIATALQSRPAIISAVANVLKRLQETRQDALDIDADAADRIAGAVDPQGE